MEKSEYCETQSRISQAAAQERSVSQERAFERGAQWAIERATAWLGNINLDHYFYGRKYIKDGIEGMEFLFTSDFYNDFKKAMNQ